MIARLALNNKGRRSVDSWLATLSRFRLGAIIGTQFSLRAHLFTVVLVAILPALAVVLVIGTNAALMADRVSQDRISETGRAQAGAIDQELEALDAALSFVGSTPGLEDGRPSLESASRIRMVEQETGLRVIIHRRDGTEIVDNAAPAEGEGAHPAAALNALAEARKTARATISNVFVPRPGQAPAALLVVPVVHDGAVVATVEAMISSDRLTAALRRQSHQPGGLAAVIDRTGRVAGATHDVDRLAGEIWPAEIKPTVPISEWQARFARASAFIMGHSRISPAYTPLVFAPGWHVVYREDEPAFSAVLDHAMRNSLVAALLAATVSLCLAGLFGTHLSRPLNHLTEHARTVAIGTDRVDDPIQPYSVTEFEALRLGMLRADAVLRRRGAAERMALREARTGHELLVSVVNGTAESIYVKDLDLRYVLVNRAALKSGPILRAEWQVLGRGSADLFPPIVANRIEEADRSVLATGQMTSFEQEYTPDRADGRTDDASPRQTRWLSMNIAPWQDAEGRVVGVVSVGRDITKQRGADTRMRAMQADLLRATRLSAMGAMASGLAHELNQPLAAATNYLNAGGRLLDRSQSGDVEAFQFARGAVSDAAQQMLRAGSIVRRLRDFVERGEAELQPEDVGDVLRQACDLARNDGIAAGIDLRLDVPPTTGIALIDRTQIQQVLLNLIRNAAEAIGPPEIRGIGGFEQKQGVVTVSSCTADDGGMMIDVSDNGPGLSPDIAERLFQPFVSTKPTGMGIGLAICRTIIEGHGGELTATNNTADGMRFRIALPALHPAGESA